MSSESLSSINIDRALELECILHEMPELKAKLSSVQNFDPDVLLEATSKPFSVLGYHMLSGLAEKLGMDRTQLPQFVGTVGYVMKKQGKAAQAARLLSLQFIEAQISGTGPDGGLLAPWATENPSFAMALVISAMVSNDAGIAKTVARKTSNRDSDPRSLRNTRSFHLNKSLIKFLSCTAFFQEMDPDVRFELLTRVKETLSATDPAMLKFMLDNEKAMELSNRNILVMQATLLVATYSHVFRKFKVHCQWCRFRIEALTGQPMPAQRFEMSFAMFEDDSMMRQYAQAHSWFLGKVMSPFLDMWVRLTGNEASTNVLCRAVQRLAGTYDMLCDNANSPEDTQSSPVFDVSMPQGAETSGKLYDLDCNRERSSVPASDPVAVPSVCEIYGISSIMVVLNSQVTSNPAVKVYPLQRTRCCDMQQLLDV